jgi:lysyl-tRNA synthetase class 1
MEQRVSNEGRPIPEWAIKVAERLGPGPHVAVTGISTSGHIHVGNLREVLVGEVVANALRARGEEVRFIFHADTIDPLRKIAPGVPESFEEFMGYSLSRVPDPEGCHASYAEHFLAPFEEALREMEMDIEVLRSHELYENGVYTEVTREALEHTEELREILRSSSRTRTASRRPRTTPGVRASSAGG